jgi:predicted nuclease of predicted toxin-antitoxin system
MKIKFQADADLRDPIVSGVKRREPMIDFKTANEAQLEGVPDTEVLARAANEGRMLVSHDVNTMPEHFAEFIKTRTSPEVVLINQDLQYSKAIDGLIRLWITAEAEDWENPLSFLPH